MQGFHFYVPRPTGAGVQVLLPEAEAREALNRVIYEELCRGVVRGDSRANLLDMVRDLHLRGAQAVILGCTELGMLLRDGDADIPLLDTVRIHCEAAIQKALS